MSKRKLSPITPEDAKSQSGYTISSYNKPRQMKGLTLERVRKFVSKSILIGIGLMQRSKLALNTN
jgi:hypothetical protein